MVPWLHEVLEAKREQIVAQWMEGVRAELTHDMVTNVELRDHIPGFLEELTVILRRHETGGPLPEPSDSAAQHGMQRLRLGFDPFTLVKEYGILRRVILDAARRDHVSPTIDEFDALSEFMTNGIARAVAEYAEAREDELRRHGQEHFAFIAHELRNPLMSARLAFDVLKRRGLLPELRQSDVLHKSLGRISDLIERSLNIALLGSDAGPNRRSIKLRDLVEDILLETSPAAEEKGIAVIVGVEDTVEVQVDPRLLSSALANLVRNAIKFTHEGGTIHVRGNCTSSELCLEVADECGGLPPGKAEELFTPFVQAGTDRSGFGLGLAIARGAIENHGGTLAVQDRPGLGCSFLITIPLPTGAPR